MLTAQIEDVLQQIIDPYLQQDLLSAGLLKSIDSSTTGTCLELSYSYPCASLMANIKDQIQQKLAVDVNFSLEVTAYPRAQSLQHLSGVKNIIAIASGKGGVGKSTTTANLALALAKEGAKVGVLDADIYGPSQAMMLGALGQQPEPVGEKMIKPVMTYGIETMSMSYLVDERTAMVWRGPMLAGALQQLLYQTAWSELDYLMVDLPPGTGDIQLTLSQQVPVSGALIITTPQDIALLDARKGIEMFAKVNISVLGVIENMSTHICSNCQHEEPIFGTGGGAKIAEEYGTTLLGQLPLAMEIRQQADSGQPTVLSDSSSAIAENYRSIAWQFSAALAKTNQAKNQAFPNFSVQSD